MRWLFPIGLLLVMGCQSAPQQGLRLLAQPEVEKGIWDRPRTRFLVDEVPVVEGTGYDGQTVEIFLSDSRGEAKGRDRFVVPKKSHELRDAGISMEPSVHGFGPMRPRYQKELVTQKTRLLVPMKSLRPGEYEVRLQGEDGSQKIQRFSVVLR